MRWRIGLTLIFIILGVVLTQWPEAWQGFSDVVYVGHAYPAIQSLLLRLPSLHNVALADVLWLLIPALFILRVWWLWRKNLVRRWLTALAETALWLSTGYLLLMLLWGMNYHREPLYHQLQAQGFTTQLRDGHWQFAITETKRVLDRLPAEFDPCTSVDASFHPDRPAAFALSASALANLPSAPSRSVTASAWSPLYTRLSTAGVYIPFTGEPTFNRDLFDAAKPFVMTHEYSHWAGYAREYDADILAYWSLWLSPDPIWQFSAWLEWWMSIRAPDAIKQQLPALLTNTMACYAEHLSAQPRWNIRHLFWRAYEVNLKNQGVPEGLKSYAMGEAMALSSYQDWLYKKSQR